MPTRGTRLLALALPAVLAAAGCSLGDDEAERAAAAVRAFTAAWGEEDLEAAGAATTDPGAATAALTGLQDALGLSGVTAEPDGDPVCEDGACTADLAVSADVAGLGPWSWTTTARVDVPEGEEPAHVAWEPALLHPELTADRTWRRTRELAPRASVLAGDGRAITEERPVVVVGVEPRRVADLDAVTALLQRAFDVDPARFAERVRAAAPDAFVEAITVRAQDAAPWQAELAAQPGVLQREDERSLTPDRGFARALVGVVGTATEEALADAGPLALASDELGLSGLQRAFQEQLAGTPGGRVELVPAEGTAGEPVVVHEVEPVPGRPLATTLDLDVQAAAERAVRSAPSNASVVVVQPSTGDVLASANGPAPTGDDRALTGQYPPGSTFKIVTTEALLAAGLDPQEPVDCPATTVVGGREFKNAEFGALPPGSPFRLAFARSCNTTVVSLPDRLDDGALADAAARLGMTGAWELGVPSYAGQVPPPEDVVDEAAAMIGQSRVLASPLAMAVVTASAVSGRTVVPELLPEAAPAEQGPALDPASARERAQALRSLMRAVVTEGTGSALAGLSPEVVAKTGTAEYGSPDPATGELPTHAWTVAAQGDLAVAVVVEGGGGGGAVAAPLVRTFLEALPSR